MKNEYFSGLDIVRGFAAVSVLVYHVKEFNEWHDFPKSFALAWFHWGWMGVDIFLIISGIAITLSALALSDKKNGKKTGLFPIFMLRRMRRILPLHYLTIFLFILLFYDILQKTCLWQDILAHLLFIHNWFPQFHRSINAPNWTLGLEMQFYVCFILLFPFINRKNILAIVPISFLVAMAWRALNYFHIRQTVKDDIDPVFMAVTQLPGMADFFACGIAIALFCRSDIFQKIRGSWRFRMALLISFCICFSFSIWIMLANYTTYWQTPPMVIFFRSMLAISFSIAITLVCCFKPDDNAKKFLSVFVYLGTISYGIYLYHLPILLLVKDLAISNWLKLGITLGATITVASLSWHFFEKRFLPGKNRK